MSSCSSCAPGRGCHDFSSRAEQLPSLAAIDVVERLLLQALKNTAQRASRAAAGELTADELREANETLIDWLADTFSGRNRHFQSAENWNPHGLADYMREMSLRASRQSCLRSPRTTRSDSPRGRDFPFRRLRDAAFARAAGLFDGGR